MSTDLVEKGYDEFREALKECLTREYNPFEPDNQSKLYYKIQILLNKYLPRKQA